MSRQKQHSIIRQWRKRAMKSSAAYYVHLCAGVRGPRDTVTFRWLAPTPAKQLDVIEGHLHAMATPEAGRLALVIAEKRAEITPP